MARTPEEKSCSRRSEFRIAFNRFLSDPPTPARIEEVSSGSVNIVEEYGHEYVAPVELAALMKLARIANEDPFIKYLLTDLLKS